MTPALLLIDLQRDYLAAQRLDPCAERLCQTVAGLRSACRAAQIPVFHVWTTVTDEAQQMPHWRQSGLQRCRAGTPGHSPPENLLALPGEEIVHKRFYSGFHGTDLATRLRAANVDTVILAGVHLRACVRTTAIDAYQLGFQVWMADDAIGDDDPLHAAVTRRYLSERLAQFLSVTQITRAISCEHRSPCGPADSSPTTLPAVVLANGPQPVPHLPTIDHVSPRNRSGVLWRVPICGRDQVAEATSVAREASRSWSQTTLAERANWMSQVARRVEAESAALTDQIVEETGKPLRDARLEIGFAVGLIQSAVNYALSPQGGAADRETGPGWTRRRVPLGVVGLVTPWNNPLAIPLGKLAPALLYGNTVVWKPAIPGAGIAGRICELLRESGGPAGAVTLIQGDNRTGELLFADPQIDAVTLTGSMAAGMAAQALCAVRRVPLQAELGGNNAAIVWGDTDLAEAARKIAAACFGAAGQRCTANRRVIIERARSEEFLRELCLATAGLQWGDPRDERTDVGPVISSTALQR
ncbi:MAG: aldehyde dehydrogenase family protein, partial [Planctomycetes bacterium]|nr:aldehyde dehydrogenase family protein [Planctomycetota bacterium]